MDKDGFAMFRRLAAAALLTAATLAAAAPARAQLELDLTQGNVRPIPVAIAPLFGGDEGLAELGRNITQVIRANLARSGLFAPIDQNAFIQTPAALLEGPRFGDWRQVGAEALIHGRVAPGPGGLLRAEIRLWDVTAEEQLAGFAYNIIPENWRRVGHAFADATYTRLTGEAGLFDTRIVYVAESGPPTNKIFRLAIMDQDGENHAFLTEGRSIVTSPRFSPTSQEITYLSYFNNKPRVYIFNIDTGQQEVLGDFPNMTFAPRFSPDGRSVVMSMAENGNSDVYVMDLGTRKARRLTTNPAIDTSASFSPDGRFIAFNSDRGGSPQLYVMSAQGENVSRISFGGGHYGSPVWSPRGDQIAFVRIGGGRFSLGVMRPDGTRERILDSAFVIDTPTWSPNGRYVMYYTRGRTNEAGLGGESRIYVIDLTGQNKREIITPVNASDPAWSPLLP
ncbi:MAG: Tol-Pal system beta propeller repeat protein TolB [Pseudomonadota bacterium]